MATAKKNIIPPVPVVENFTVSLELSKEEAILLRDVLHIVGGSPVNSRRRHAQSIMSALVPVVGTRLHPTVTDMAAYAHSIYFESPEEQ